MEFIEEGKLEGKEVEDYLHNKLKKYSDIKIVQLS